MTRNRKDAFENWARSIGGQSKILCRKTDEKYFFLAILKKRKLRFRWKILAEIPSAAKPQLRRLRLTSLRELREEVFNFGEDGRVTFNRFAATGLSSGVRPLPLFQPETIDYPLDAWMNGGLAVSLEFSHSPVREIAANITPEQQ